MKKKNKLFLLLLFAAPLFSYGQGEKISSLSINPQLYNQHLQRQQEAAGKKQFAGGFFIVPETLTLPFVDDFSVNHLRSYDLSEFPIIETVNRSFELTGDTLEFIYMNDTSWRFEYNTLTQQIDSFPKDTIQLVLNDDQSYPYLTTETVIGWPIYYRYTFDGLGNRTDSTLVNPDSIKTIEYSHFYGVSDPNALWIDNHVFINDDFPTNKLSYGVATFDGLKANGLPHNNNSLQTRGPADTLTSQFIDLSGFGPEDSIYFSFSYQPKGLGEEPEGLDSLILEFKILGGVWRTKWSTGGSDTLIGNPQFTSIQPILIDDAFSFVDNFQFRFRNLATITGNNDHWHIDYVYLNSGRRSNEIEPRDVAVQNRVPNILSDYTSMPWYQFKDNQADEVDPSFALTYRNNSPLVRTQLTFSYVVDGTFTPPLPPLKDSIGLSHSPFDALSTYTSPQFSVFDFIPITRTPVDEDSVVLTLTTMHDFNTADMTRENDTITREVRFENYFAYDDGTAERAYGLEGPGLKKFAYEFNLNKPDTLRALQFQFSKVNEDLSLRELTLVVWGEIGPEEDTLFYRERVPFHYVPEKNGFTLYRLDSPIVVQTKFYVGWLQLFEESIEVGLDMNNSAADHMFYYTNGSWKQSTTEAAPMIRAIVGKNVPLIGTGVENQVEAQSILLYPNPSEDFINLKTTYPTERVEIYDLQGKLVKSLAGAVERIEIRDLSKGLYFVRVFSGKKAPQSLRFVKL